MLPIREPVHEPFREDLIEPEVVPVQGKVGELLGSRKFWVSIVAIGAVITFAVLGKVAGDQAMDFIKWIIGAWLGSQAATDVAKVFASKSNRPVSTIQDIRTDPSALMQEGRTTKPD
jgi:hypothetical protein